MYTEDVKHVKSAVKIDRVGVGFARMARPNGYDQGGWDGWEVDEGLVELLQLRGWKNYTVI